MKKSLVEPDLWMGLAVCLLAYNVVGLYVPNLSGVGCTDTCHSLGLRFQFEERLFESKTSASRMRDEI